MIHDKIEMTLQDSPLTENFNFEIYKQLFASDTCYYWNQLWQIINYIKAYRQGIEISLLLIDKFEIYREHFDKKNQEHQLILIFTQFLNMLDKADFWEEYLINWELIKEKSFEMNLGNEYSESSRDTHFKRGAKEYFIADTDTGFRLSFLYSLHIRKELIERKQKKSKKGDKIKNLLHEQQEELTEKEIKERYDWMIEFFKTGNYDFSPPVSKQKKKRRTEGGKEVNN